MPGRLPVFVVAADKLERAKNEMRRLAAYLEAYDRSDLDDPWSRTATIAFAIHSAYTGVEDVMLDVAGTIDGHVPSGASSHQGLLDQMRASVGARPPLLDDPLYAQLIELKSFRHLVRHHYGIELRPDKTEEKHSLMSAALSAFERAMQQLEKALEAPES